MHEDRPPGHTIADAKHFYVHIPAAVRNTRRSIGEAPYLPLPAPPQPPELHHFR